MKVKTCLLLLILSFSLKAESTKTQDLTQDLTQDFSALIGAKPTVEINLGAIMLSFLSSAAQTENQDIAKILSSLDSVKVTVFELSNESKVESLKTRLDLMAEKNSKAGMEKIASIKEDDSLVYFFAEINDKELKSLNISALDDEDELVLITIRGNILIEDIGGLLNHFNVNVDLGGLDALKLQKN